MPHPTASSNRVTRFRDRAAALGRAGLPIGDDGSGQADALADAVGLGADGEALLAAAVRSGQDLADRGRGLWRPWFYPALVCSGAALGVALLGHRLTPLMDGLREEFNLPRTPGLILLERIRVLAPVLVVAAVAALAIAWRAVTVRRWRESPLDPLRAALGCETLAALADAGAEPTASRQVADRFGLVADACPIRFVSWAVGEDTGAIPRAEALRLAARVARSEAARRDGEARRVRMSAVALAVAGVATLAYGLVLFVPVIEFFLSISAPSASR